MKYTLLLISILTFIAPKCMSQINIADSTFQAVTYWNKGETQQYDFKNQKIKIKGADTTSKETTTYNVEVLVLDSTEKTYTVQWTYKNIITSDPNPAIQKLTTMNKDMKVIFKTDEVGIFLEVVNWKEIKDFISKALQTITKDFDKVPEMKNVFAQLEKMYSTKEGIENGAIKDIQQFHSFYGSKYKLGEVIEGKLQLANMFGGKPFDADFNVYLDEINQEDNNVILRSAQEVNKEQLTNETFAYMLKMAENMKVKKPERSDLKDLKNEILTASRIHGSGWIVYSVKTTTVNSGDITSIEECEIEIK
jgi:hypothetical protein